MAKILVHLTHGPEHPTRAALAFHVAKAAVDEGHNVTMFLAGDAVQLLRDSVIAHLEGLGTGELQSLYEEFVASGSKIYYSGGSAAARGLIDADLAGKPVERAGPPVLVRLAVDHDRMFSY